VQVLDYAPCSTLLHGEAEREGFESAIVGVKPTGPTSFSKVQKPTSHDAGRYVTALRYVLSLQLGEPGLQLVLAELAFDQCAPRLTVTQETLHLQSCRPSRL